MNNEFKGLKKGDKILIKVEILEVDSTSSSGSTFNVTVPSLGGKNCPIWVYDKAVVLRDKYRELKKMDSLLQLVDSLREDILFAKADLFKIWAAIHDDDSDVEEEVRQILLRHSLLSDEAINEIHNNCLKEEEE